MLQRHKNLEARQGDNKQEKFKICFGFKHMEE